MKLVLHLHIRTMICFQFPYVRAFMCNRGRKCYEIEKNLTQNRLIPQEREYLHFGPDKTKQNKQVKIQCPNKLKHVQTIYSI